MATACALLVLLVVKCALPSPVPEFGIPGAVSGSSQVIDASNQTSSLLQTATNRLNTSLTSNYTKLQTTLVQLGTFAKFTASIDRTVVVPLLVLTRDTSGDVSSRFKAVLDGIISTQDYINNTLPVELNRLELLIQHYVPDRLKDGFECVRSGLNQLNESLTTLQAALVAAIKEAGTINVSGTVVRKYVNLKSVFDVARAISSVKVCIPSIIETINSTIDRLKIADEFVNSVRSKISNAMSRFG